MTKDEFTQARKTLNLNQREMAQKLGYLSVNSIWQKEQGQVPVSKQDEIIVGYLLVGEKYV